MSGTQMSRLIRALLSLLAYHLGVPTDNGAVRLVGERPKRGVKEKLFRSQVADHFQILRVLADTEDDDAHARRRPSRAQLEWLYVQGRPTQASDDRGSSRGLAGAAVGCRDDYGGNRVLLGSHGRRDLYKLAEPSAAWRRNTAAHASRGLYVQDLVGRRTAASVAHLDAFAGVAERRHLVLSVGRSSLDDSADIEEAK